MKGFKNMKNRNLRKYLSVGRTGILIFANCTPIDLVNANIEGFRAIYRYNNIQRNGQARKLSKTHTAQPIYDSLGNYAGFRWVRKQNQQ